MPSYLLEIGCEEIPAAFIPTSYKFLLDEWTKRLSALNLPFSSIESGGTPRRLYVNIEGLPVSQVDKTEIIMGPPANIAFNSDGSLTEAAKKFAASKGIDESTLKKVTTQKGDYLQGEKRTGGEKTADLLMKTAPEIIKSIPFPKSMKWGNNDFRFVRPIHWFLSVYDEKPLVFETDGITASNITYGHRFLAPAAIEVKNAAEYKEKLENAFVYIETSKRRDIILAQIKEIEAKENVCVEIDEDLLNTVSDLVEYPNAILGSFEDSFLTLPEEVLITSMKIHQKYFPVKDSDNTLINKFAGVANIKSPNGDGTIRLGYERVLRARLNDALFFYNNDKKVKLEERAEQLKKVVYQEKLGTSYEKMERFKAIASFLAEKLCSDKKENVEKTAYLCKADLLSEMVYEFPELQGIMGYYYAKNEGIDEDIARGIMEHYLPKFAGDVLPETDEGRLTSIADKIDTISGVFAAGMKPTGNLDPYGLRRSAIGIISIIEQAGYRIELKDIIEITLDKLSSRLAFNKDEVIKEVLSFINLRYRQMLVSKDIVAADVFDAVCDKSSDILKTLNLAKVLTNARGTDGFQTIAQAFKRINNILKKNNWDKEQFADELLQTDEEKALGSLIRNQNMQALLDEEKNYATLDELMKFAPAVDNFFEKVMVMAEDEKIRENRLGLIACLRKVFLIIGDLGAIAAK
ncbi:MAG TPA: glycine--tRNA ligase subunit beta [Candidatus Mucispirillum faecigallinarum]|uniref:Glycine--tRNA ligase beta subunit n=1 Tax=Candidatus Mucispirillum faecigallinarum TaxID=2838699 RepID=A0A9D2GTK6_9BACT|nr:glycine--tRNA ligase subunit beta [Candidatus Mucispirillum faecigallinarum]